ncbi:MAG: response regulator [Candidatus Omnitrophica bacterium]|nr:response regulator [Candidatus Omnitrophota bacterium]
MLAKRKIRKVLIVDDNKVLRELFNVILSRDGFVIGEAKNGKEALEKVIRNKPDAIILDIAMPGMNGFTVCQRLRENSNTKNIPIIFCTAKSREEISPYKTDIDEYIEKPFSVENVRKKIKSILLASGNRIE